MLTNILIANSECIQAFFTIILYKTTNFYSCKIRSLDEHYSVAVSAATTTITIGSKYPIQVIQYCKTLTITFIYWPGTTLGIFKWYSYYYLFTVYGNF